MKVFIDLGSHFGSILRKFVASDNYSPDCVLHAFEPNPKITAEIIDTYPAGTIFHREAAWIDDCELDFYMGENRSPNDQGCSVLKEKSTGGLDTNHPEKIRAINFSKWLRDNFTEADHVLIKCNIEGAEFAVFEKIMFDGNMGLIKNLILKLHGAKIGMSKEAEADFVKRIRNHHLVLSESYEF